MNDYLNQLRALMDFYQQNGPQPLVAGPGGDSVSAWNAKLRNNNAFTSAVDQMGRQQFGYRSMPDFFAFGPEQASPGYGATPPNRDYPQYGANEAVPADAIGRRMGFPVQNALARLVR